MLPCGHKTYTYSLTQHHSNRISFHHQHPLNIVEKEGWSGVLHMNNVDIVTKLFEDEADRFENNDPAPAEREL